MPNVYKLQYNGRTILNNAKTGYIGFEPPMPVFAVYYFSGSSSVPMTYKITSGGVDDTFTVNNGSTVQKTLRVGDILTITASSGSGKTFSLKGLECFNVSSATWNHKNAGSSVSLVATFLGGGDETVISYDNYRDKSFTMHGAWYPATNAAQCYDYQPGVRIETITTVMVKNGHWKDTYTDDVADISNASKTQTTGGGYGANGWSNYSTYSTYTYEAASVFNLGTTNSMSVTYSIHNISCGSSTCKLIIWGRKSGGGSISMKQVTSFSRYSTQTYGPFTSNSTRSPILCVEMGSDSSSMKPMSHEGTCECTGVMK